MSEKTEKPVLAATVDVAGPRLEVPVAGWRQCGRKFSGLKRLAEAAKRALEESNADECNHVLAEASTAADDKFQGAACPDTVLSLLAENERLAWAVRVSEPDYGDVERLCRVLGYLGVATPESGEEAACKWLSLVRALLRTAETSKLLRQDAAVIAEYTQLKAENEALRKDAERYRFVRNPIGTSSPLAIWNEGKMPLFSGMADAVVDEFMGKEVLA